MKAKAPKAAQRENPLVPFALMRRMYAGMVETRLLEEWLAKRGGAGKRSHGEGQEACRAAVVLSLEVGDLLADAGGLASSAWMRGSELAEATLGRGRGLLPAFEDAARQIAVAVGAAAAVKQANLPQVIGIFLDGATKWSVLHPALSLAAKLELPMLFVMLPSGKQAAIKSVAGEATRLGVPGIPVEASDTIAICRVAQESILRARAGSGPALLECVRLETGKRADDPIAAMGKTLLRAGAADEAWIQGVRPAFRARLKALPLERTL